MKYILFLVNLSILLSLFSFGCVENNAVTSSDNSIPEIPSMNHDLGYIPYDAKTDDPNYIVCDSTNINSGRNRIQYEGGSNKLREDITSQFSSKKEYETFNGYIVVRFMVNCEGKTGRFRAQCLNLDFSRTKAPSDLVEYTVGLIKSLDSWNKSSANDSKTEYSKFINLKIHNGEIQHVLL